MFHESWLDVSGWGTDLMVGDHRMKKGDRLTLRLPDGDVTGTVRTITFRESGPTYGYEHTSTYHMLETNLMGAPVSLLLGKGMLLRKEE